MNGEILYITLQIVINTNSCILNRKYLMKPVTTQPHTNEEVNLYTVCFAFLMSLCTILHHYL